MKKLTVRNNRNDQEKAMSALNERLIKKHKCVSIVFEDFSMFQTFEKRFDKFRGSKDYACTMITGFRGRGTVKVMIKFFTGEE